MSAVLSERPIGQPDMHESQYYDWLMLQARLLREGRIKEADLAHIAQELEDMGNELEAALVSFFRQTLVHLCKLRYFRDEQPRTHWTIEIANFRSEMDERSVNRFSNPQKIEEIFGRAWQGARQNLKAMMAPADFKRIPVACPFTLDQVRDHEFFPQAVAAESLGKGA